MEFISNIEIINNTSDMWMEVHQTNTYKCQKHDRCKRLQRHSKAKLQFKASKGLFGASNGVGADSWFQNSSNTASFLLEWGVPACNKPWARVKNLREVSVKCDFDGKDLIIQIDSPHQHKTIEPPKSLHREITTEPIHEKRLVVNLKRSHSNSQKLSDSNDLCSNSTATNSESNSGEEHEPESECIENSQNFDPKVKQLQTSEFSRYYYTTKIFEVMYDFMQPYLHHLILLEPGCAEPLAQLLREQ